MSIRSALFLFTTVLAAQNLHYTRGVGVYPGNPAEDFSPVTAPDPQTYRNIALRRPAYQSSSYDFYHTAQLVTDGIKDTAMPRLISVSTSDRGVLSRQEREHALDHNLTTRVNITGASPWIQVETWGGNEPYSIDRIDVTTGGRGATGGNVVVSGSEDGASWRELGRATPAGATAVVTFPPSQARFYRVAREGGSGAQWSVSELAFYNNGVRVEMGGPFHFTSAWKPGGSGEEWVYVDLGSASTFDRVVLNWIRGAAAGSIQASDDAKTWRTLAALPAPSTSMEEIKLASPARGRYVRLLLTKPATPDGYVLSEFEVFGRGGLVPHPHAAASPDASGRLLLSGGNWRVQRDSLVHADGTEISQIGFPDQDWVPATVPATVLSSYWNAGALPDPNYGDNINNISDSFFYADFWYRNEFVAPRVPAGRKSWLYFRGINWKADVYLNNRPLGRIEGGFLRAKFDVTGILKPGAKNAIAVRIVKNDTPGSPKEKTWQSPDLNGGALGADNPTYHATAGWDWIPTVRGRDTGIWSDIYLDSTGPVALEDPWVRSSMPLPDTSRATIDINVTVHNYSDVSVQGVVRGRFGDIPFEISAAVGPRESRVLDHRLEIEKPKLWWPAGYGEQSLYPVQLSYEASGKGISDRLTFQSGVRQFTYTTDNNALKIFINGRRFIPRGGNWGFPEVNLRYRAREYDAAVRYHKDMNFNMIRDWVGQTGDDEFYDACDRHGIVVWQDFWLANPSDGPEPNDNNLFLRNSEDFIKRIRNHPSIGLFCGRNEGNPPQPLNDGLRGQVDTLDRGIVYIPNSAQGGVSGGGPYRTVPPKQYFQTRATTKLHSELGMPNIPPLDSVKQMMPESAMWPQGDVWGIHDFTRTGAQGGTAWLEMIQKNYGGAANADEWVELSQFINYDGYRAIFEAQAKNRMGVLLWMSHPCWPSFVWQTYDYYFDTSAGYFGSKKGSEPLHIQWNPLTNAVEVVNYSAGKVQGLSAHAEILNRNGAVQWQKTASLDSEEDGVKSPIQLEFPAGLTPVHFIRLRLTRGAETVSDNFYLRGLEETDLGYDLKDIRSLPKVKVEAHVTVARDGARWILTTELHNASSQPALMVRVKPVRETSGDRILPAISSDNYIALMPGERRTIRTEVEDADTRGERPRIAVEGFNVE